MICEKWVEERIKVKAEETTKNLLNFSRQKMIY